MRFRLYQLFMESPFEGLLLHAQKVQEGGPLFRQAISCYLRADCDTFEQIHMDITRIEGEADRIKQNIRGHLPRGMLMPVDKFQFLWCLREQDNVLDAVEDALHWLSYRTTVVPEAIQDDLLLMVDKAVEVMDQIPVVVQMGMNYFQTLSKRDRIAVKDVIHGLRHKKFESDQVARKLMSDIFVQTVADPTATFHLIRLIEYIGKVPGHGENAGDMMRAMIAR